MGSSPQRRAAGRAGGRWDERARDCEQSATDRSCPTCGTESEEEADALRTWEERRPTADFGVQRIEQALPPHLLRHPDRRRGRSTSSWEEVVGELAVSMRYRNRDAEASRLGADARGVVVPASCTLKHPDVAWQRWWGGRDGNGCRRVARWRRYPASAPELPHKSAPMALERSGVNDTVDTGAGVEGWDLFSSEHHAEKEFSASGSESSRASLTRQGGGGRVACRSRMVCLRRSTFLEVEMRLASSSSSRAL